MCVRTAVAHALPVLTGQELARLVRQVSLLILMVPAHVYKTSLQTKLPQQHKHALTVLPIALLARRQKVVARSVSELSL